MYELPGGHIDFGENIVDGLKREIREEFEIDVNIGDPFAAFDYTNEIKGSHSIEVIYFATLVSSPDDIKLHPEDHSSYEWIARDEIQKIVTDAKGLDDIEIRNVQKAFDLLHGGTPGFGS